MSHTTELLRRVWYLLSRCRFETRRKAKMARHGTVVAESAPFGNPPQGREASREVWRWGWLDGGVRDVRFAARGLRRTPVFTLVSIVSLAVGLALTTSTVSVVNAYLVRSLPYPEADRLYHVMYAPPGPWEPRGMSGLDWTSVAEVVDFPIASLADSFDLAEGGHAVSLRGLRVTRGFSDGLGISVVAGRRFAEHDFAAGSEQVALIGHSLWRDRFGSDLGAIGRLVRVEPESAVNRIDTFRVVGVLPPGFYYGPDSRAALDLMVPHTAPLRAYMVRLGKGVTPAAAEDRLTTAARRAATSSIPANWTGIRLESAHERWVGGLRPALLGITIAVCLVLVIGCANVAVLILLRSMQRQKEVAVRLALGSGRRHIARMLLAEAMLICSVALGAGVAMTAFMLGTLAPLIERQLGRPAPNVSGIAIDATVLLVVGGMSLLIAVTLSLAPLAAGPALTKSLQQDARVASDGRAMARLRGGLIAFEIAGSLVLLVGCGLAIRSVVTMMTTPLGFEAEGLTKARVVLRARDYPDSAAYGAFHRRFAERVSQTTGAAVVFSNWPPFVPPPTHLMEPDEGNSGVSAGSLAVSDGYFASFAIPMREGREFTAEESSVAAPVAVLSETLAKRLWPAGGAVGRRVRGVEQTPAGSTPGPWRTVVGIARDVRQSYDDADQADFYTAGTSRGRFATFYHRTRQPAAGVGETFRTIASEIDARAVVGPTRLLVDDDKALAGTRFVTVLLTGFAGVAAFLAMLGIYGVTAYAVEQRHKEVAIRVALGASARTVVRMFLRQGVLLLGAGALLGLSGGVAASWALRSRVFGVQTSDPVTYLVASALLVTAGFITVWLAARRAALTNPVDALTGS